MAWSLPAAGELRASIRIDRSTAAPGSSGANVGGVIGGGTPGVKWSAIIDQRRAKLEPSRGGTEVVADRMSGKATYDLWVRSDSQTRAIHAGDRAVDLNTGAIYALGEPIDPNQRKQWLLIQATSNGRTS